MNDEERAEEYILSLELEKGNKILQLKEVIKVIYKAHLDGLAEGRKEKWHDLTKSHDDLPKCAENEQIIFYVKEYYKEIGKYINHFCLGFYKKSFLNDDVKVFVERSKGYECEHSTETVLRWCELPKFEE